MLSKIGRTKRQREERLYEIAAQEIERGEQRKGLWAKALAEAKFDLVNAKARYLKLRVQSLADEEVLDAETIASTKRNENQVSAYEAPAGVAAGQYSAMPVRKESQAGVRWAHFVVWVLLCLGIQFFLEWVIFGETGFDPLQRLVSLLWRLRAISDYGWVIATIDMIEIGLMLYCIHRAFRVLRPRHVAS